MIPSYDEQTLAFYDREAEAYAARCEPTRHPSLDQFINALPPGGSVLELGCGGGQDAQIMLEAGLRVIATDGSPGLAAEASKRLGRRVKVMRFDELREEQRYDGVWANACLLHLAGPDLVDALGRIWRALKTGGVFYASFKAGDGPGRDALGRYYNFPTAEWLEALVRGCAPWSELEIDQAQGGGYDGVERTWLLCRARAGAAVPTLSVCCGPTIVKWPAALMSGGPG